MNKTLTKEMTQIKEEIRHLTKPLLRTLIIVVCLIIGTGAVLRFVHKQGIEAKHAAPYR